MPGNRSNHNQVVYTPLANPNTIDGTNLEIDGDDDELGTITVCNDDTNIDNEMHRNAQHRTNSNWRYFQKQHGRSPVGLRQFRTILFALASVLLIIFILKLATYKDHSGRELASPTNSNLTQSKVEFFMQGHNTSVNELLHDNHHKAQALPIRVVSTFRNDPIQSIANRKPKYDNYISSVVDERDHKSVGDPKYMTDLIDDFRYSIGDERLSVTSNAGNKWWSIGIRNQHHVTISNYVRAMKSFNYNTSVTLVTQLVLESQSFHHTLELCERWDGPISVSIFLARGLNELPAAISLIKFVRQCLPAPLSGCMRDKLTWHLVFTTPKPDIESLSSSLTYPKYHLDTINYSSFADTDQCPKFNDSSAFELIRRFQDDILAKNNKSVISLAGDGAGRSAETPVNVLRNVARHAARTKYVLVTNVDLYPSVHLASNFNELINGNNGTISSHKLANVESCIFPLPAFEMHKSDELHLQQQLPKTKRDLIDNVSNGKVWPYREPNCVWCHEFADEHNWLSSNAGDQKDELTVFKTTEWTHSGTRGWSPFFLAENSYPDYNENLMANERVDLMYEMCIKNYSMIVLNNGFLIRVESLTEVPGLTSEHVMANEQIQSVEMALSNLAQKYKGNANIKKC